jgi:glycine betaine/proline transport system permease protein
VTVTDKRPTKPAPPDQLEEGRPPARLKTGWALGFIVLVWVGGWALWQGTATLALGGAELTGFHEWLNEVRDSFDAARDDNWFFQYVIGPVSAALDSTVTFLQNMFSQPHFPWPVPEVGWLGVVALLTWVAYALAAWRSALLVLVSLLLFGSLGYWADSIDLLIITGASVAVCLLIGLPVGIWMARSKAATAPLVLVFGIGPASAIVTTLIYALPPLVRITAHGIRNVSPTTVEAARSIGVTRSQMLRHVQLPMAKRTIIVGVNQCTMAALSMATIAALIDGPGLGQPVVKALQSLDIGDAFVSGIAIVIMAIMLDRTTTAASERSEQAARAGTENVRRRRIVLAVSGVAVLVAIYLSRIRLGLAEFPERPDLGTPLADGIRSFTDWFVGTFDDATTALKDLVTYGLLNPLQTLLADSPWWLMALVLLAVSFLLGGWRPAVTTLVCEAVILGTGLWNETMKTLTMTLVATLLVMLIALAVGVWMGRSRRADTFIRPILDALQTIPPFVYLVPVLALFATTRFTAIIAAVAYGVPIATKLIADGIRGVSPTSVEAARAAGTTAWQMIAKVQLPMARASVVLAANQGLLYVLSMVVIGGLVGGGGLGYLVVAGFSQAELFGKGLAAGIAITALGVMLDRIMQYTAARYGRV